MLYQMANVQMCIYLLTQTVWCNSIW